MDMKASLMLNVLKQQNMRFPSEKVSAPMKYGLVFGGMIRIQIQQQICGVSEGRARIRIVQPSGGENK